MRDLVDVDAAVVGFLLVITIPALREGECGGKGVMERSGKGPEGKAGSSLEGMTRARSLVGIMGDIANHFGDGQDKRLGSLGG